MIVQVVTVGSYTEVVGRYALAVRVRFLQRESDVAPLSTPDPTGAGTQTAHYAIAPTHPGRTHSLSSQHVSLQRSKVLRTRYNCAPPHGHAEGHIKYKCATRIMHTCTCFLIALHTLATDSLAVFRGIRALTVRPGPGRRSRPPRLAPGAARSECPVTRDALRERSRTATFSSPLSVFCALRRHRLTYRLSGWENSIRIQKPYVTLTKTGAHTRTLIQTTLHYT
jgi:hypothetical protein